MLHRHIVHQLFVEKIQIEEFTDLLLSPTGGHSDIAEVMEILTKFDSVTEFPQCGNTTVLEACSLFDSILAYFPSTSWRLQGDANIVHSLLCEFAFCKIQDQKEDDFTISEAVTANIPVIDSPQATEDITELPCVQQVLKKTGRCVLQEIYQHKIHNANVQPVKQFFSKTGILLDNKRERLFPSTPEKQLFLHASRFF